MSRSPAQENIVYQTNIEGYFKGLNRRLDENQCKLTSVYSAAHNTLLVKRREEPCDAHEQKIETDSSSTLSHPLRTETATDQPIAHPINTNANANANVDDGSPFQISKLYCRQNENTALPSKISPIASFLESATNHKPNREEHVVDEPKAITKVSAPALENANTGDAVIDDILQKLSSRMTI